MMNDRAEKQTRVRPRYSLFLGGRLYKKGGYRCVKSAFDAFEAYAKLVPETHRVPCFIAIGEYAEGATDYTI